MDTSARSPDADILALKLIIEVLGIFAARFESKARAKALAGTQIHYGQIAQVREDLDAFWFCLQEIAGHLSVWEEQDSFWTNITEIALKLAEYKELARARAAASTYLRTQRFKDPSVDLSPLTLLEYDTVNVILRDNLYKLSRFINDAINGLNKRLAQRRQTRASA